jgi:adenylate cyclase
MASDPAIDTSGLRDWLVNGAPGVTTSPAVVQRVSEALRALGVPIDHTEAFVRTLHPHIAGRALAWKTGQPLAIRELGWAFLQSAEFAASPVGAVFRTGVAERRRRDSGPRDAAFDAWLDDEGLTDYVAEPLTFVSGDHHAIVFATRAPGGFRPEHVAAIESIRQPLARIGEIYALSRTAANLLDTYVGRNAGARILKGHIQRGDIEPIDAVLWFSDLRGFTGLAGQVTPSVLITALNELFECQVPAIERHGGEVLKFIGDGLLAIFPIERGGRPLVELCDGALDATAAMSGALAALNLRRAERSHPLLEVGIALHVGQVSYGNIGGSSRLDFTCIGEAVNLAARLEGVAGKLGLPLVVSEAFARATSRPTRPLGSFELKGIKGPQAVFEP